jgi:hypothetical protein
LSILEIGRAESMHATTYYGEFHLCDTEEGSELAKAFARMFCQLNHPSMTGRTLDVSAYLKEFIGKEGLPQKQ